MHQTFEGELFTQLVKVLTRVKEKEGNDFLRAFFTDEERVMLAKRIAVVGMLRDDISTYRITQALKMSSSTVARMKREYEAGRYDALAHTLGTSKREREEFWKTLEVILRAGMPPRGKGRWEWLKNHRP